MEDKQMKNGASFRGKDAPNRCFLFLFGVQELVDQRRQDAAHEEGGAAGEEHQGQGADKLGDVLFKIL